MDSHTKLFGHFAAPGSFLFGADVSGLDTVEVGLFKGLEPGFGNFAYDLGLADMRPELCGSSWKAGQQGQRCSSSGRGEKFASAKNSVHECGRLTLMLIVELRAERVTAKKQ